MDCDSFLNNLPRTSLNRMAAPIDITLPKMINTTLYPSVFIVNFNRIPDCVKNLKLSNPTNGLPNKPPAKS